MNEDSALRTSFPLFLKEGFGNISPSKTSKTTSPDKKE
jgi:hypothetical protein